MMAEADNARISPQAKPPKKKSKKKIPERRTGGCGGHGRAAGNEKGRCPRLEGATAAAATGVKGAPFHQDPERGAVMGDGCPITRRWRRVFNETLHYLKVGCKRVFRVGGG